MDAGTPARRGCTVSRTGNRAQSARLRAREARLALMVERNAQDQRIESAVAAALLAWEARAVAAAQVEDAERDVAAGLVSLSREKVSVRDMAAMTGIGEAVCGRLLKLPASGDGPREPVASGRGDVGHERYGQPLGPDQT